MAILFDSTEVSCMTSIKQAICDPTAVKTIAQEINLEQVISPEMPRLVSPVVLVRDIDPFLTDWFRPSMDMPTD